MQNSRFLKIEAKAFEAGDFLNIFLRFWGFWGSFSCKNFSYKKKACIVSNENFHYKQWLEFSRYFAYVTPQSHSCNWGYSKNLFCDTSQDLVNRRICKVEIASWNTNFRGVLRTLSLYKNWNFPFRISSVNVIKSAVSSGFGHITEETLMENFIFYLLCQTTTEPNM